MSGRLFLAATAPILTALRAGDAAALQAGLRRNVYQDRAGRGGRAACAPMSRPPMRRLPLRARRRSTQGDLAWPDPVAVKPDQPTKPAIATAAMTRSRTELELSHRARRSCRTRAAMSNSSADEAVRAALGQERQPASTCRG